MNTRKCCALALAGMIFHAVPQNVIAEPISSASNQQLLQQIEQLQRSVQTLQETVLRQQSQINEMKSGSSFEKGASPEQANPVPAATPLSSSSSPAGLQAFNPEIGVVADVLASATESGEDEEGNDRLSLRELELVFGHEIDPFARLDATLAFSDFEDPEVEEAYVTLRTFPWLGMKLGRLRPRIGIASSLHRDQLDTVDEPLVVQRYLGVEGLSRTAFEVSGFLPVPWESVSHELLAGVMEGGVGEDGELFGETRRRPSFYASWRNFWDISDTNSGSLAASWMTGVADESSHYAVRAYGLHARFDHHFSPYRKVKLQGEAFFQDRSLPLLTEEEELSDGLLVSEENGATDDLNRNPFGYYGLIDFRIDPTWATGLRFDQVELTNRIEGAGRDDTAYTAYVSFLQSEFARWRAQYQYVDFAEGGSDNRFFLQGTFAIGVHKHQLQ